MKKRPPPNGPKQPRNRPTDRPAAASSRPAPAPSARPRPPINSKESAAAGRGDQPRPDFSEPPADTAWGIHPVKALLQHRPGSIASIQVSAKRDDQRLRELVALAAAQGIAVQETTTLPWEQEINHQGVVARLRPAEPLGLTDLLRRLENAATRSGPPLLLALDSIQDPRNLGAIIRTAAAFGVDGLILPKDRSAPLTGTVMKTAAGTLPLLAVCQVTNLANTLAELKKHGFWIYGAGGQAPTDLYQSSFQGPVCLVMGNEQKGLRPLVSRNCDHLVAIPMAAGVESLNVAVATGVILAEIKRQNQRE